MKQNLYTYSTWNQVLKHRRRKSKAKRLLKAIAPAIGVALGTLSIFTTLSCADNDIRCDKGTYYDGNIITSDGNIWGYDSEELANNEIVNVTFHTNGTNDVTDDEITVVDGLDTYQTGDNQIAAFYETEFGCMIEYHDGTGFYWDK